MLETRHVVGRGDEQDVLDAAQHERGQRVVDHRLVVHGLQLLAGHFRQRVEARAGAAGEDDALHFACPVLVASFAAPLGLLLGSAWKVRKLSGWGSGSASALTMSACTSRMVRVASTSTRAPMSRK